MSLVLVVYIMFGRILLGLAVGFVGGLMCYYSGQIAGALGRMEWVDKYLGGTRQAILFFGLLVFIVGGLIMLGMVGFVDPTEMKASGFN